VHFARSVTVLATSRTNGPAFASEPEDPSTSLPGASWQQHTHSRPHGVQHTIAAARAAARAEPVAINRAQSAGGAHRLVRAVLPHCEYSKYPCENSGYQRAPGGAHGRRAVLPHCGAVRRTHPRAADARGRCTRAIAPLNPQPPRRLEYSRRTACPQRRGHCGSAVRSEPEWRRGNKRNHNPHSRTRWHRATSGCNGP
jgi:hypothetical protein